MADGFDPNGFTAEELAKAAFGDRWDELDAEGRAGAVCDARSFMSVIADPAGFGIRAVYRRGGGIKVVEADD